MSLLGKKIFILEDNTLNRVVYRITLTVAGAYLDFDGYGRNTMLRLRKKNNWDLIILDLMLGHSPHSGYDLFERIRAEPSYDNVPIIAISASEPSIAIPKARSLGFDGFISKPIDEDVFVDQISSIIEGNPVWFDGNKRI